MIEVSSTQVGVKIYVRFEKKISPTALWNVDMLDDMEVNTKVNKQ